jgi:MOSC domain-containing protein YiiM
MKIVDAPLVLSSPIEHLYISPGHNYFGHHGKPADDHPRVKVEEVRCVEGHGLEGDRFFDYKPDYSGQITFFAMEVYDELCRTLGIFNKNPGVLGRNVFIRGVDLNNLIGKTFALQNLIFSGSKECSPCYWMDQSFGPGAETFLKGRGGLRARILTSGTLRCEPVGTGRTVSS